jgi:hypothetical protein
LRKHDSRVEAAQGTGRDEHPPAIVEVRIDSAEHRDESVLVDQILDLNDELYRVVCQRMSS